MQYGEGYVPGYEAYRDDLPKVFPGFDYARNQLHHDMTIGYLKTQVEDHPFVVAIPEMLRQVSAELEDRDKVRALEPAQYVKWDYKKFDSCINKLYRKNVLQNKNFPADPPDGLVTPENIYSSIEDVVRTQLRCRFVDGIEPVLKQIRLLADECNVQSRFELKQTRSGYHAGHALVDLPELKVSYPLGGIKEIQITLEIQVHSELQSLMYEITHPIYDRARVAIDDSEDWRWNPSSVRMQSVYLGHVLHYIDASLVRLRKDVFEDPNV